MTYEIHDVAISTLGQTPQLVRILRIEPDVAGVYEVQPLTSSFTHHCREDVLIPLPEKIEQVKVTLFIDGERLESLFTEVDAEAWLKVLRGHFPEAEIESL